ncbi:STAS domain-containing protein [Bacillus daqingensis]|uniref:STAS domain-containing protein n=1 Tax=Bacillus daqingensis TaxID=872396 RepID=A0ABV9NUL3_9BACI
MPAIGNLPDQITLLNAIDSIGENILIADTDYRITWMNTEAVKLFNEIALLYGYGSAEDLIGMQMNHFHEQPEHQQRIMASLEKGHRTRITIKDQIITDIVITAIQAKDAPIEGYVVMLQDVTRTAERDAEREKMLEDLSVPIMHVWENTIAVPMVGSMTEERSSRLVSAVLEACTDSETDYVIVALSGIHTFDETLASAIRQLCECLQLIGTECLVVGIGPSLAMSFRALDQDLKTYQTTHQALEQIMASQSVYK